MKVTLILAALFAILKVAPATNFYTMADGGDYANKTTWSTDGTTGCNCKPSTSLSGDTIYILHNTTFSTTILLKSSSYLFLEKGKTLSSASGGIDFENSEGQILGSYQGGSISTDINSVVSLSGKIDVNIGNLNNSGIMNIDSVINIHGIGNKAHNHVDANSGTVGTMNLNKMGTVNVINGRFLNQGVISFGSNSCASVNGGGMFTNVGSYAAVLGVGGIYTNDTLKSTGYWDPNVMWCANVFTGSSQMPPMNCATNNCTALPVLLSTFEVNHDEAGGVFLNWESTLEISNDYFTIERSTNGKNFEQIKTVKSSTQKSYSTYDEVSINGTVSYRLSQTDYNGQTAILGTRSIHNDAQFMIQVSPNPFDSEIKIEMNHFENGVLNIEIISSLGQTIWQSTEAVKDGKSEQVVKTDTMTPGVYFVKATMGNISKILRIVHY